MLGLSFMDAPLHRNFWVCHIPAVRTVNPPEYGKSALDISKAPLLYGSEYNTGCFRCQAQIFSIEKKVNPPNQQFLTAFKYILQDFFVSCIINAGINALYLHQSCCHQRIHMVGNGRRCQV